MYCTNCGKQLPDTVLFCTQCGKPTTLHEAYQNQNQVIMDHAHNTLPQYTDNVTLNRENTTVPVKKNKSKFIILAGVSLVVILAFIIAGNYIYQRHVIKQADYVLAYQSEGNYDEALKLYEKYSGKKDEFDNKVLEGLNSIVIQIKDRFANEEIDYSTAKEELDILNDYNISKLDNEIYETSKWIDKINTSRDNYKEGMKYYEQGDLSAALEKYKLVISEDVKYYNLAKNEIDRIELRQWIYRN